jgi:hypothetical protein
LEGAGILEATMKQRRVRRVKNIINISIALVMVLLVFLVFKHKAGSFSPVFIPLPGIIMVLIMGGMLMNLVSIIFNGAEISVSESPGRKFMTAQHGMRVARVTGVIVLVMFILFTLLIPYVEDYISTDEREPIDLSIIKTDTFDNIDDFDVEYAKPLTIEVASGPPVLYNLYFKDLDTGTFGEEPRQNGSVPSNTTFNIPMDRFPRGEYKIELWIEGGPEGTQSDLVYKIDRHINSDLKVSLTTFLLIIAIANLAWTVVTYILMRRYEVQSVGGLAAPEDTFENV